MSKSAINYNLEIWTWTQIFYTATTDFLVAIFTLNVRKETNNQSTSLINIQKLLSTFW